MPPEPLLAFSTLACPEWTANEVVREASRMGFDAIEWRGGPDGHVRADWGTRERSDLRGRLSDAGIGSLAVTAYSDLVADDPHLRAASVDDLVAHAELAASIGARFVRAFVGRHDRPLDPDVLAHAADGLARAADGMRGTGVGIAVEPHDEFVAADLVARILHAVADPLVGAVWDVGNAWAVGETPDATSANLGPFVRYVQLKDGTGGGETWRLTALGDGDVPLRAALELASANAPSPPLSIEWERAWHPDLAPAAVALPAAARFVRSILESMRRRPPSAAGDMATTG
ncbi:MAG TPA: sugar phosphate isomerase/epimerase family protein [Candidatus Limnocylindrales bacterium]|nr:sugar phosphate isomerase/epimerase family protein [Candidatus Limnocylindrales bacterium]